MNIHPITVSNPAIVIIRWFKAMFKQFLLRGRRKIKSSDSLFWAKLSKEYNPSEASLSWKEEGKQTSKYKQTENLRFHLWAAHKNLTDMSSDLIKNSTLLDYKRDLTSM